MENPMTEHVTEQLRRLAAGMDDLQGRVRRAVAGEVGRAVAEAVGEVLAVALGGPLPTLPGWAQRSAADAYGRRSAGYGPGGWDDPDDPGWDPEYAHLRQGANNPSASARATSDDADPVGPAALAVAVAAGRWWLHRRHSPWQAAGAGLAAGAAVLAGGPAARTALAVLLAVHRLLAATDALRDGAKALDPD
jgi:hypothetical protein